VSLQHNEQPSHGTDAVRRAGVASVMVTVGMSLPQQHRQRRQQVERDHGDRAAGEHNRDDAPGNR
jgi:hypothetical protein